MPAVARAKCRECGVDFKPRSNAYRACCSRRCGFGYQRRTRMERSAWRRAFRVPASLVSRPCLICGKAKLGRSACCSEACLRLHEARKARAKNERKHAASARRYTCCVCRSEFTRRYGNKRRATCSDICHMERVRRERRKAKRGLENHRRRARHYGVEYEPVRRQRVLERDGWRCGICGGRIWKNTKHPHPKSGTLDHIVPLAAGGGHTYRNVQAAHFGCNSLKRDSSAGEQLLLVG